MDPKDQQYRSILTKAKSLLAPEDAWISKLANCAALLHEELNHFWTGFYLVENNQLTLGPFQGPVACTTIKKGKGVCGTAWAQNSSQVVEDVHTFPGHIACSAESNSEIVVPISRKGEVIAVLDIDSTDFGTFNKTDQLYLEELVLLLI